MNDKQRHAGLGVSKPEFESAVKNPAFSVRVDFGEGRVLMRRKNNLPKAALAGVGDVFRIKEQTNLSVTLFAEDTQHPKMSCPRAVT